jgi:hypothetical protein
VVLALVRDVSFDRLCHRSAHGKRAVTTLPFESGGDFALLVDPSRGVSLHELDRIGNRKRWMGLDQQMHVVFDPARLEDHRFVLLRSPAHIGKEFFSPVVGQQRTAKFGAKDDVDQDAAVS